MKALVTGGAGFIGSTLCYSLIAEGFQVVALDNFSSGSSSNLFELRGIKEFSLVKGDCKSDATVRRVLKDINVVFHFAANPKVRLDKTDSNFCFEENVIATQNLLEGLRHGSARNLVFASSSTVYGDATIFPTPENYSPLVPVSVYGAAKLASEALISGYAKTYGFNATILRLANIVGPRSDHGVIPDLIRKLRANEKELEILGDGSQRKSYLFIEDCISAVQLVAKSPKGVSTYNIGSEDQVSTKAIADIISKEMNLHPTYRFASAVDGGRGWVGDVKEMLLDISKIKEIGWKPKYSGAEAVKKTAIGILQGTQVR
jgi:UDP-glucose 4-epimerase